MIEIERYSIMFKFNPPSIQKYIMMENVLIAKKNKAKLTHQYNNLTFEQNARLIKCIISLQRNQLTLIIE